MSGRDIRRDLARALDDLARGVKTNPERTCAELRYLAHAIRHGVDEEDGLEELEDLEASDDLGADE